jgi:hypothetical protein
MFPGVCGSARGLKIPRNILRKENARGNFQEHSEGRGVVRGLSRINSRQTDRLAADIRRKTKTDG